MNGKKFLNQKHENELIINKNHSILVLKKIKGIVGERVYILSFFDKNGLSLMTLTAKDIKELREFIGEGKDE